MNRFLLTSRQRLSLSSTVTINNMTAMTRKFSSNNDKLLHTVYHDMHVGLGGKMVSIYICIYMYY